MKLTKEYFPQDPDPASSPLPPSLRVYSRKTSALRAKERVTLDLGCQLRRVFFRGSRREAN